MKQRMEPLKLTAGVFNGPYPEAVRTKPGIWKIVSGWFGLHARFNPLALNWRRQKFLADMARERMAMASMDDGSAWDNALLETRGLLMRCGFKAALTARLFVLLEPVWARYRGEKPSAESVWAAFLMLKGCAVETDEAEAAMLLCACAAALIGVSVHWAVADERRAAVLAERSAPLFLALGMDAPMTLTSSRDKNTKQVTIASIEGLARDYLQDSRMLGRGRGRLELLLERLDGDGFSRVKLQGLCFALIENIDFRLLEKAFSIVEADTTEPGQSAAQITLYELFCRYQHCAGSLLGPRSMGGTLWNSYGTIPVSLSGAARKESVSFFKTPEQKWDAIAARLAQARKIDEKICLLVTTAESLENARRICLSAVMVKKMTDKALNAFDGNALLLLCEPFPWLGLDEWLHGAACRLIIADFCDSPRVLHHLGRMNCRSAKISVEMIFSANDEWLLRIQTPFVHCWTKRLLEWRGSVRGRTGGRLLECLLARAEAGRKKLHGEMGRWLWQMNRMFSFSKDTNE
ncbi:MAG: hypothetical protein GY862_33340 [Gammaproteobacteria bacterium]|nr:hypothetical protein [Gammaproteobacteria bacterium]